MIKKLNKKRVKRHRPLVKWYLDKGATDYSRIFMQLLDIEVELRELKDQIWIHVLRLRHAIKNTESFQIKTELKFQEKIVLDHIANIKKLKKENSEARRKNYEKEYGEDAIFF